MPMATTSQAVAKHTRRRVSPIRKVFGQVRASRSRQEGSGVAFNLFPAIAQAFPGIFDEIVEETTESVGEQAQAAAPVQADPRPGDPEPGNLRDSMTTKYRRSKKTGGITSGTVEFPALDPTHRQPRHTYALAEEAGSVHNPAHPFLLPAIMAERPVFNAKLRGLEARIRGAVGR